MSRRALMGWRLVFALIALAIVAVIAFGAAYTAGAVTL